MKRIRAVSAASAGGRRLRRALTRAFESLAEARRLSWRLPGIPRERDLLRSPSPIPDTMNDQDIQVGTLFMQLAGLATIG